MVTNISHRHLLRFGYRCIMVFFLSPEGEYQLQWSHHDAPFVSTEYTFWSKSLFTWFWFFVTLLAACTMHITIRFFFIFSKNCCILQLESPCPFLLPPPKWSCNRPWLSHDQNEILRPTPHVPVCNRKFCQPLLESVTDTPPSYIKGSIMITKLHIWSSPQGQWKGPENLGFSQVLCEGCLGTKYFAWTWKGPWICCAKRNSGCPVSSRHCLPYTL